MRYSIEPPKWNNHMHRYESNIILNFTKEVIAIGCGEIAIEAEDRAEIIVAGLKLHNAMSEDNTPKSSIGVQPVG